eukprot:2090783-Rhodomonas_salina.1
MHRADRITLLACILRCWVWSGPGCSGSHDACCVALAATRAVNRSSSEEAMRARLAVKASQLQDK